MQWFSASDQRQQRIIELRDEAREEYPSLWLQMITEWQGWSGSDSAWLTYSANYLFSTAGFRWAMDPFHLSSRLEGIPGPDYAHDLNGLSLVVLTHNHSDHVDWSLIHALADMNILWVIPNHMQDEISLSVNLPKNQVITPINGIPIHAGPLTLTPFDGLHYRAQHGVPATGYLAEFVQTRWLFPGDTRTYDAKQLPLYPDLDGMMAHLWLGKESASADVPPLLDEFCDFCCDIHPSQTVVTHLFELGRDEHDLWDLHHYQMVKNNLKGRLGEINMHCAMMGDRIRLNNR
jgi:hypothetical protein